MDKQYVEQVRRQAALHVQNYRATDGVDDPTVLILTTTGRRSGEPRSVPLIFGRDGDRLVLVASLGGAPHHPIWYLNVRDDPKVFIQVQGERFAARARTASGVERARLWRLMVSILPDYEDFQARTTREIPLVVVERNDS
jgi:deazaflavin-dependent oxidoreductase (nitroreductase family)